MSTKKKFAVNFFIYIIFIIYIIALIDILLLKHGGGFIVANHINKYSFADKLSFAQLIPFKTIKGFLLNSPSSLIGIENLLGNTIIFLPFGFALPIISSKLNSLKKIFLSAFSLSLAVEVIQLLAGLGFFDIDDLILNTLGAVIGFVLYKLILAKR